MRRIIFAAFLFCFIQTYAKTPIPEALLNAKTAFVKNTGAEDKDFAKFCAALKKWGRFELVEDIRSADIVISLYTGIGVRNMQNPSVSGGGVYSLNVRVNYIRITDALADTTLWSDETPGTGKNPEILVSNLKDKMKKK
jgi:hypothetical protein